MAELVTEGGECGAEGAYTVTYYPHPYSALTKKLCSHPSRRRSAAPKKKSYVTPPIIIIIFFLRRLSPSFTECGGAHERVIIKLLGFNASYVAGVAPAQMINPEFSRLPDLNVTRGRMARFVSPFLNVAKCEKTSSISAG